MNGEAKEALVKFDSASGVKTGSFSPPDSVSSAASTTAGCGNSENPQAGQLGQVYVKSDGSAQAEYFRFLHRAFQVDPSLCIFNFIEQDSIGLVSLSDGTTKTLDSATFGTSTPTSSSLGVGAILPDGNGGAVYTWHKTQASATTGATVFNRQLYFDDATDATVTAENIGEVSGFLLGADGLLYGVVQEPNGLDHTLLAVNPTSGEAWRQSIPHPSGKSFSPQLLAASKAGGVVVQTLSGVLRYDSLGSSTADNTLDQLNGSPRYLGGGDGTIWAGVNQSPIVVQDVADFSDANGDPISDWFFVQGQGKGYRAAKSASFSESAKCSGFDGGVSPQELVVAQNGGSQVKLKIKGAFQNVVLVSDTQTVQVSPAAPTRGLHSGQYAWL